jgi:hypothetical protein
MITPEVMLKLAADLEGNAVVISKLAEENDELRKELKHYRCKEAADTVTEMMVSRHLIDPQDSSKIASTRADLYKMAMEDPQAFRTRADAVKLAAEAGPNFMIGGDRPGSSDSRHALDRFVAGDLVE